MSVHPSSIRVTPSNLSMSAWNASLRPAAAPASSTKSVSSVSSNRSRSRETPAQADHMKSPSATRARSVQPLQHLDVEEYDNNTSSHPFAIPYQTTTAPTNGATARERSHSLSRAPDSSKRIQSQSTSLAHSQAPALHTSKRFAEPRISRPLLSSGYIQTEGQEGLSLTEQYKLLQEQHQRLSSPLRNQSPSPTRQSPVRHAPLRQSSAAALHHHHHQQQPQQHATSHNQSISRSAARSRSNSRTNRLAAPPSNPQSPPLSPNLDEQEHSSIRSSLLEAESAANAPGPVVLTSPARGVNPSLNAALQNELSSLDQQIRQNTQELLIMQQQQHLQSLQQQQATIAAQMRESAAAAAAAQVTSTQSIPPSNPTLPLPNTILAPQPVPPSSLQSFHSTQPAISTSWAQPQPVHPASSSSSSFHMQQPASAIARSPSPVFRGSSASPFRSRSSSASFAHLAMDMGAPPSTAQQQHTLPASSPLATVPTPLVSKNNPFVSLVDAIDGVLAKSAAGNGAPLGSNPTSLQSSPIASATTTNTAPTDGMSMNAAQQALQQFQFWQQQQQQLLAQQQQQQQTSQPLKTPIQLVSENHDFNQSSSTLSPAASLSNTANIPLHLDLTASTPAPAPAPVHSHAATSHAPEVLTSSSVVAASIPATATASSSGPTAEEEAAELAAAGIESGVFDEHPELAAQNSVESLRLSNLLLRDKGTLLLKKHTALRLKFKAVRALLGEYYRRKDREVALVRMDTFVEHKVSHMKSKCLQHFRNIIQSHRRLVEKRKAKLNSLIRFSVAHQVAQERIALQLGFARWKEVALRLAMRAVQNQWMKDWEEDIAFESRRTKLAAVLSRSSHRLEKQVFTLRSKAWAKWKTLTTYERVKDVFDKHGSSWASDRQALLQLVLEANENREILIRQTETQRIEYETLKGSYQQVSHIALQNNELINHIASLNQELSTLRDSAQHRRRATFDKAAKVLSNAVWNIRCRKVRQSFAYWLTQIRIEKETQLQSQMAQIHQTLQATHAAQQQQDAVHAQSIAQLQNSFNKTMQQPPYAQQLQLQPQQQPQNNHRQISQQSMGSPYSATISPQQNMNSQSFQLPNGSPMSDSFQMQPSPVTQSIASPRTLQQLALDPTLVQFLPGGNGTSSTTTSVVDAKLAEFEAAKLQLEKETLSLAARLAATRMQQPPAKSPVSSPMGMTLNNTLGLAGITTPTVQPQLSPIDTHKFQQQIQEQQATIMALQQQQQQLRQAAELQRQQQQFQQSQQQLQQPLQQSPVAVAIQPAAALPPEAHRSRSHSIHSIAPTDQTFVSLTQYAPPAAATSQTASLPGLHARELDDSVVVDARSTYPPQYQSSQLQQQPQQQQQRIFQQQPPPQQSIAPISPESPAMLAFAANTRVLSKEQLIQPPLIFDEDADSNASIVTQPSNSLPPYNTMNNHNIATLQQHQQSAFSRATIAPAALNGNHPSASPVSANSYKSSSTSNGVHSSPSTGMNGNHTSPSPMAAATTTTTPLTAANLAASTTAAGSTSAFSAQSPTRQALLQSVFSEFHRAYTARSRAAAGTSPFDASKFDNKLAMEDLPKALRKVGLRAGDLQTAKLSDADMNKLVTERGWNGREFIEKDAFQLLAQSILFKLNF